MLKYKFRVFILLVLLLFPIGVDAQVRNVSTDKTLIQGEYEEKILTLVNEERKKAGVEPLTFDRSLVNSSRQRAVEISVNYDAHHLRTDNRDWSTVISEFGVSGNHFGENIAYATYSISPESVFDMWISSTVHRNNILNPDYSTLGVGIVKSRAGYYYWVQNFGNGLSSEYIPFSGYSESNVRYNLRYEDGLATNVTYDNPVDVKLDIGDEYNVNFVINTINNSHYPENVILNLLDWNSSNTDVVSVNGTGLVANKAGVSVISTTFGNQVISFKVIVGDGDVIEDSRFEVKVNYNEPIKTIDINDGLDYELDTSSNNTVTQFYSNGEIINKSALDVRICTNKDCTNYLKPTSYVSDDKNIVDYIQGEIIFINNGQTSITAIFENGVSLKIPVNVYYFKFDKNEYLINVNENYETSVISDFNNISYHSDDESIVTIDKNGKIIGIKDGTTYITAIDNDTGLFAKAQVVVKHNDQVSIEIDQYNSQLVIGESSNLKVTVYPVDTIVTYSSSNESIVVVDGNGKVTAMGCGEAVITVSAAGKQVSVKFSVKEKEVIPTKLEVDKTSVELYELETVKINATVSPIQTLRWYSDNNLVASVDNNGLITAIKNGSTTIHVVSEDGEEILINVVVKVREIAITEIKVDRDELTLVEGNSVSVKASVYPTNTTLDLDLRWESSNTDVVTVNNDGLITAKGYGEAEITITAINGVSKVIKVKVNKKLIPISKIVVDKENISLKEGETSLIKATVYPLNTTDNQKLRWSSSNENVVTVDDNGNITAVSAGNAIITVASVNGVSTSISVEVYSVVTDIKLNYNELLLRNDFILDIVHHNPSNVVIDKNKLRWASSNTNVVIVDNGVLVPVGIGEATITVFYEDASDECHVIVDEETSIKSFGNIIDRIDNSNYTNSILIDNTLQLGFIINEELNVLSKNENYKLKWEVSNNLFIDQDCNVRFIKPGLGIVKVSYGMYSTTRYFNVYDIKVNFDKDTIYVGDEIKFNVNITTPDVTSERAHYEISDNSIATITSDGILKGLKNGEVVVRIYSIDREVYKSFNIKVINKETNHDTYKPNNGNNGYKPTQVTSNGNKDNNSDDNEIVANKFEIVLVNDTFTIENKNGKAVIKSENITNNNELKLSDNEKLIALYNIYYESGNNSTFKDPTFIVRVPVKVNKSDYDSIYVALVTDGNIEKIIDYSLFDNYIEIQTDRLDNLAIIGTKSKSGSIKENDKVPNDSEKTNDKDTENLREKSNSKLIIVISVFIVIWTISFIVINKLITRFSKKKKSE